MSDLCTFAKNIGRDLYACFNFNSITTGKVNNKIDFPGAIWDTICPKKDIRHNNIIKYTTYINNCVTVLCNYFNDKNLELDPELAILCEKTSSSKINELLVQLNKLIHESQRKLEEDDKWTRANTIASIIASISTIAVSVLATVTTVITYRITKASIINAGPPINSTVAIGMKQVTNGLLNTIQEVNTLQVVGTETTSEQIAMNNLIAEVKNLISEVSTITDDVLSAGYRSTLGANSADVISRQGSQLVETNVANIGEGIGSIGTAAGGAIAGVSGSVINAGTGIIGGVGLAGIAIVSGVVAAASGSAKNKEYNFEKEHTEINKENNILLKTVEKLGTLTVAEKYKDIFNNDSIIYSNPIFNEKDFIQQFVNDFKFEVFDWFDLITIQAERLREHVTNWNNAFCYYVSEMLFCRFPLREHSNETSIILPDNHIDYIIYKNLKILCYIILDNLWCNWSQFTQILLEKNYTAFNQTKCPWDFVGIRIHQYGDNYKIEAIGDCYNQTFFLKA
ncbi:MAG: hypothetical protein ACRCSV_03265 [Chlamydiales bacterium]